MIGKTMTRGSALLLLLWATACVTINVYFPAAAAEQAADRIIEEVWGKLPPPPAGDAPPQSRRSAVPAGLLALVDFLIPPAQAQDINVSSPAIESIKAAMTARSTQLFPFFDSGAVGLTQTGGIAVRDLNAVSLPQRNPVKQLVALENADRDRLYREIASVNGQPQWEADIRATFARQWVSQARPGWWYEAGGGWQRK